MSGWFNLFLLTASPNIRTPLHYYQKIDSRLGNPEQNFQKVKTTFQRGHLIRVGGVLRSLGAVEKGTQLLS